MYCCAHVLGPYCCAHVLLYLHIYIYVMHEVCMAQVHVHNSMASTCAQQSIFCWYFTLVNTCHIYALIYMPYTCMSFSLLLLNSKFANEIMQNHFRGGRGGGRGRGEGEGGVSTECCNFVTVTAKGISFSYIV